MIATLRTVTRTVHLPTDRFDVVEVRVSERGEGRPVLLLHGGAGPASVTGRVRTCRR